MARVVKAAKTNKYTNEDVVGFKIEAESTVWDTPRRSKRYFMYTRQKINVCALWFYRKNWLERNKRKTGFKFQYEIYQYYDLVAYFMILVLLKVIKEETIFSFPYRLGNIKLIKFKSSFIDRFKRLNLNLHSLRMRYKFIWNRGVNPGFKFYKFYLSKKIRQVIYRKVKYDKSVYNYFFYLLGRRRHGAWVNAPERDYDKLQQIIEKNYGVLIYKPTADRLDRRQRARARERLDDSIEEMGD